MPFAGFSINAHRNGAKNANAMFQKPISLDAYVKCADDCDADQHHGQQSGPATAQRRRVLVASEHAGAYVTGHHPGAVQILGQRQRQRYDRSSRSQRPAISGSRVCQQPEGRTCRGGVTPADVSFFELHDAFTIMSALSLEATGYSRRG